MKILVILHVFLPKHAAGTETYSYYLAKELQDRGHDVHIYFTERDGSRPHAELRSEEYDGLPCSVAVNNHSFKTFRDRYKDEGMEASLNQVLDEVRPEIVHVQHLELHSIGYIDILKARDLKIVYTLHEFNLMCHRNGILLRDRMALCEGPELDECTKCTRFWLDPEASPAGPRPRYSVRRFLEKGLRQLSGAVPGLLAWDPYRPAVELRFREIKAALRQVDLFISPSRFLRDKFIEYGFIDEGRIIYSDNGFEVSKFQKVQKTTSEDLRVGFIGAINEWKGVHLLVEAFNGLPEAGVVCLIHGDLDTNIPEYGQRLRKMCRHPGVQFLGKFENTRVAEVLAGIDVLVVPSIWFENSPLTIHEAFLAGVPVLCADRGGMAELVEDKRNGLHFRMGDADDLRKKIARLMEEPGLLEEVGSSFPEIKDIQQDADAMEDRFHTLIAGRPLTC